MQFTIPLALAMLAGIQVVVQAQNCTAGTGTFYCCNTVAGVSNAEVVALLKAVNFPDPTTYEGLVGLGCNPPGLYCTGAPACCTGEIIPAPGVGPTVTTGCTPPATQ
ncbi:unnamed protein product [Peniophora sp. CBMAI 1063]|nr:unnamed protein product [Peniophora sp. CBMAI 1063]